MAGCTKEPTSGIRPGGQSLPGKLFYYSFHGSSMIDLSSMKRNVWRAGITFYDWDVSLDGTRIIEITSGRTDGMADQVKFTSRAFDGGGEKNEFYYRPINGGTIYISGKLSPDNRLFCIAPTFEEGLVLLQADGGGILGHLEAINGERISRNTDFCWLPDNSLVICWKSFLLRLSPPYNGVEVMKEMPGANFGHITANRAGTKMAMTLNDHIWVMDIASGELYQATESTGKEVSPAFSPDDKFIVMGTGYKTIGVPGSVPSYQSYMKVIPADGKTYNVEVDSEGVIPVIAEGEVSAEPLKGEVVWTD